MESVNLDKLVNNFLENSEYNNYFEKKIYERHEGLEKLDSIEHLQRILKELPKEEKRKPERYPPAKRLKKEESAKDSHSNFWDQFLGDSSTGSSHSNRCDEDGEEVTSKLRPVDD